MELEEMLMHLVQRISLSSNGTRVAVAAAARASTKITANFIENTATNAIRLQESLLEQPPPRAKDQVGSTGQAVWGIILQSFLILNSSSKSSKENIFGPVFLTPRR